jgi:hypothetical protein
LASPLPDTHAPSALDIPSPEQLGRRRNRVWLAMLGVVVLGLAALGVAASFSGGQVEQAQAVPSGQPVTVAAVGAATAVPWAPATASRRQPKDDPSTAVDPEANEAKSTVGAEPKTDQATEDEFAEDEPVSLQNRFKAALKEKSSAGDEDSASKASSKGDNAPKKIDRDDLLTRRSRNQTGR